MKNQLLIKFIEENKLKPVFIYENLEAKDTRKIN